MDIGRLLNQTVQVEAYTGKDSFTGEASYSPAVTYPARIEYVPDRVLAHNGTEIPTYATVFVAAEVGEQDRLILPDGTVRTPKKVARLYDGAGVFHHSEVHV